MESPSKERAILDIKVTQAKHRDIVKNLLPAHAISGCDTTACYFGIGKCTVIKVLKDGYDLSVVGNVDAPLPWSDCSSHSFHFSLLRDEGKQRHVAHKTACMGVKSRQGHSSSTNLAALPPTREAFIENVKRAHFQAPLRGSISVNPELSPEECRWKRYTANKTLCLLLYQTTQNQPLTTFWKLPAVDAKLIHPALPAAPKNAVVGSKDYLTPYFVHALVWGVWDFNSSRDMTESYRTTRATRNSWEKKLFIPPNQVHPALLLLGPRLINVRKAFD